MPAAKPQPHDDLETRLALIEHQVNGLANIQNIAAEVDDVLDELYAQGVDPGALDALDRDADDLLAQAEQIKQSFHASLELARTMKAALDDICRAVKDGDRQNPLVDSLLDQAYEEISEDAYVSASEMFYEDQVWGIEENTGLTAHEAGDLLDILNGDHNLDPDDPAWEELREWIKHVQQSLPDWRQSAA